MTGFIAASVILQVAMVVVGHFVEVVRLLSGPLGVGVPFILGMAWGAGRQPPVRDASRDGFVIGAAGAFVGVLLAILLGDQGWALLTFAPISSGLTGLLGAIIGRLVPGR